MNKSDLVLSVANAQEISQRKASDLVDTVITSILEGLDNDGEVTLRGFGSLQVVNAAARTGRNIKTGETISIPARNRVKFKSYIELV